MSTREIDWLKELHYQLYLHSEHCRELGYDDKKQTCLWFSSSAFEDLVKSMLITNYSMSINAPTTVMGYSYAVDREQEYNFFISMNIFENGNPNDPIRSLA